MICIIGNGMIRILREMLLEYSRSVSLVGRVSLMVEERRECVVVVRKSGGKRPLGTGRIILKWILKRKMRKYELDFSGAGYADDASCCRQGNIPSGSIR
jgi:hypothetical protein